MQNLTFASIEINFSIAYGTFYICTLDMDYCKILQLNSAHITREHWTESQITFAFWNVIINYDIIDKNPDQSKHFKSLRFLLQHFYNSCVQVNTALQYLFNLASDGNKMVSYHFDVLNPNIK